MFIEVNFYFILTFIVPQTILKKNLPFITLKGFCTYESQATEGSIPPELLKGKTILTPDRVIGILSTFVSNYVAFMNFSSLVFGFLDLTYVKER